MAAPVSRIAADFGESMCGAMTPSAFFSAGSGIGLARFDLFPRGEVHQAPSQAENNRHGQWNHDNRFNDSNAGFSRISQSLLTVQENPLLVQKE